jgi:N-acetylneuraminic acid mutarotase
MNSKSFSIFHMQTIRLPIHLVVVVMAIYSGFDLLGQIPGILSHQGRVAVGEVNFDGIGLFKFALVNADGNVSYWSNDGTSLSGGEPSAEVAVNVRRGIYSVLLGDTSIPNMGTIPASVFSNTNVRLRVWFNDGAKGWQKLSPDQRIAAVGYAMTAGDVPDGSITAAKIREGAVTNDKLAPGSALANLNTSGQAGIPTGGLILSVTENQSLLDAGYVKVGSTMLSNAAPSSRSGHSAVWTGTEMIIWGGVSTGYMNDGARYDPAKKTWRPVSVANAPSIRADHIAVWSGTEMIVWGGTSSGSGGSYLRSGGCYNPATDSWSSINVGSSPSLERNNKAAVWTGTELIIWGGQIPGGTKVNSGWRYNPTTNTWQATTTTGAPTARNGHSAVWTGSEMIVWGGTDAVGRSTNTGARYNPSTDSWIAFSGSGASYVSGHDALWTGNKMIIFGGEGSLDNPNNNFPVPGAVYDPALNSWINISNVGNPTVGLASYGAAWTGSALMIWGGFKSPNYFGDGYLFNPVSNTWTTIALSPSLGLRSKVSLINAGGKMIVWGGFYDKFGFHGDGASFDPATNTWDNIGAALFMHLYQKP